MKEAVRSGPWTTFLSGGANTTSAAKLPGGAACEPMSLLPIQYMSKETT